jgi:hypothetical protein
MRLAMTLLVKNERDIIAANLDYHLEVGVEHIIVTDNASEDGTRDLLSDYGRLSEVTVWDEPGDDYSQHEWVTRMARAAADDLGAEWIINSDADEFWTCPGGRLPEAIESGSAPALVCHRRNMVGPLNGDGRLVWWERLVYRAAAPPPLPCLANPLADPLPGPLLMYAPGPKVAVRGRGLVRIHQGNHSAEHTGPGGQAESAIVIYHYPVRSAEQFERKVRQGGDAYTRNTRLPMEIGWHWRRWHRMIDRGGIAAVLIDTIPTDASIADGCRDGSIEMDTSMARLLDACVKTPPPARGPARLPAGPR